jgi:glycosyltransferase involved in cell wall biosynthesis
LAGLEPRDLQARRYKLMDRKAGFPGSACIVSGDFVKTGGMDRANYALATHLADRGAETHLVAHRVDPALSSRPNVIVHRVPKILGSYVAAGPLLDRTGRRWASRVSARGGRAIVNGGNCRWGDINWVHYVHAAFESAPWGSLARRIRMRTSHAIFVAKEKAALSRARVIFTNSNRTRRDLVEKVGIRSDNIHTVYYGTDPGEFRLPAEGERAALRVELGLPPDRCLAVFVGALGDRRKGVDTLFEAWKILCADAAWDADLVVVGTGAELPLWIKWAAQSGIEGRIHFLGFRSDVPAILRSCDVMAAPARYEAYGLAVQEALCTGLPAIVATDAGVAERYSKGLADLLLADPRDARELAERLRRWRAHRVYFAAEVETLAHTIGAHTWERMAQQMMDIAGARA